MLFRQGDVFVQRVAGIPSKAALQVEAVLAEGELTGHQHRILDSLSARLFRHGEYFYLDVVDDFARLVHDEHATIWWNGVSTVFGGNGSIHPTGTRAWSSPRAKRVAFA